MIVFYGCSALTALCLRNPDNAQQVVKAGGAQTLVQVLKTHKDTAKIMVRGGGWVKLRLLHHSPR